MKKIGSHIDLFFRFCLLGILSPINQMVKFKTHFKIIILKKPLFCLKIKGTLYCWFGSIQIFVNIFSLYLANIYTFITHILNGRYLIDTIKIQVAPDISQYLTMTQVLPLKCFKSEIHSNFKKQKQN